MPNNIQRAAPFLVLAGLALMPRSRPHEPPSDKAMPDSHSSAASQEPGRGRQAEAPREIPLKGWRDILIRAWKEFGDDQAPLVSAGITFYALLALFPALGAFVALYGIFADPADAQRHLQFLSVALPPDALSFLNEQMTRISATQHAGLSLAFVGGLLLSVWSANGAMKAMIMGLNIAYDEKEKRGFVAKTATSLAFTLGFLAFGLCAIAVIAAPPAVERLAGRAAALVATSLSWPLLLAALGAGLAMLYRFGPSRDRAKWRWISWGSVAALLLWVGASAAFSAYVANFADYEKTYGSLGAAIGFMMWVYFSAQVVLLGAELNSEIEHQTAADTTVGAARPLGRRGAAMADTIGAPQGG